ncbi:UpxY family transcription antiterminator [Chitinophaga sp. SYP-B3965]|jgi:transcription antitermination factor NusG|uniref:UpxY family transcription antiterminator n=1 Tax=Chitinophaga sp. SYP-B3965 TaxID=2663120 RepID=UPI001299F2CA|nr:UpxY family transcription antiterminator [Chitinophaga sp. SYP-B3965]MRG43867.1 UpxY family transcription antiterminator [Chitinophaga sp. SYP-B3965]
MQQEMHAWYALYTRSRAEKKVAEILTRKQIESYCPLNQVEKRWSDRRKIVAEPLFSSYVFVRIPERMKQVVREVEGVVNFVYWLGKPAVIQDAEIDLIQRFLREHKNVTLEKVPIRQNDLVEITAGPFIHHRGRIIEVSRNKVKAVLSSLGYAMIATIAMEEVVTVDEALEQPYI